MYLQLTFMYSIHNIDELIEKLFSSTSLKYIVLNDNILNNFFPYIWEN